MLRLFFTIPRTATPTLKVDGLLGEAGKKSMLFWRVAEIGFLVHFCISEWDLYVLRKQAMTSQDVLSFNISIISFRQRTMLARSNSQSKGKEADRALSSFISVCLPTL